MITIFKSMIHTLRPCRCVKEARWERGSLNCPCGNILALRYEIDDVSRLFIYPEYQKFEQQIIQSQQGLLSDNVLGTLSYHDFSVFMENFKLSLPTILEDDEELDEADEIENEEDTYLG